MDQVWPHVLPMVERGLKHGEGDTITSGTIRNALLLGEMQMWAVHRDSEVVAAIVFRIVQHMTRRRLFVVMIAGHDLDGWVDQVEEMLMDYRDIVGADSIEASCRHGLARYLAKRGWSRKAVIMRGPEGKS